MNTTLAEATILKTDVLGRVKMPAARREQLLDEFERSGLSGLKFAALAGIKCQTFATWAQKRRRQRGDYAAGKVSTTKPKVQWLEAVVEPAQGAAGKVGNASLVLHLAGGARLELSDAQQVGLAAALLRALQKPC